MGTDRPQSPSTCEIEERGVSPILARLPLDRTRFRPGVAGKLLYHLLPIRRRVVLDGLRRAFGAELDSQAIRHLAQCCYSHTARSIHEIFSFFASSENLLKRKVRVVGHEHLVEAARGKRGVLVLTGHFGNWETAPLAALLHFHDYYGRFHFVRTALFSRALESLLFRRYRRFGLGVIPKQDALPRILEALSRNDAVVFVLDQHVGISRRLGIPVEFFGRKAGTHRSLALVARHTGAPVIPATSWRESSGHHVIRFDPPVPWIPCEDPAQEIYRNTRRYNQVLEGYVREHPDQYFWFHRRWRIREAAAAPPIPTRIAERQPRSGEPRLAELESRPCAIDSPRRGAL